MTEAPNRLTSLVHRLGVTGPAYSGAFQGTGAPLRITLALACLLTMVAAMVLTTAPALAAGPPETPETGEANPATITATTATLEGGVLNPGAAGEVGEYEYRFRVSETECEGENGTSPEVALGAEKEAVPAVHLTNLQPNVEYSFCLVERNLAQESSQLSPVKHFTTPPAPPAIESEGVSSIKATEAHLEGVVNPNNETTECKFQYGTDSSLATGTTTALCEPASFPASFGGQGVGLNVSGLTPDTTYYYRVVASNASGEAKGTAEHPFDSFKTEAFVKPLIDGESFGEVTQTDAHLHALINPNYQATKYQFMLGTTTGYTLGAVLASEGELGAGFGDSEVSVDLKAAEGINEAIKLQPNTEYHYQALATNASGSTEGLIAQGDQHFLTLPNPPTVLTGEASEVSPNSATISGSVNPGSEGVNSDTTYYFQYSVDTSYQTQIPLTAGDAGQGESAVPETANLTGLEPDTTYHYRIVASNDNANTAGGAPQVVYGKGEEFKTLATPPILGGASVSGVTQSAATIEATLDARGLPTRWELRAGSIPGNLESRAAGNTTGSATEPLAVSLASLTPGAVYYYKLTAVNPDGTVETTEGSFTTSPAPPAPGSLSISSGIPLLSIPSNAFAPETGTPTKKVTTKTLSRAQKLKGALKACRKTKSKSRRAKCEKQARKQYVVNTNAKGKKHAGGKKHG